jgi:hypothetical protein
MEFEIDCLMDGTILLNGYPGYLATDQAVLAVKKQCGVEIVLAEWEVRSHRFKIGRELISSFSFRPKKRGILG